MNIYLKSKIYCIMNNKSDLVYVGATTQPLKRRFSKHLSDYKTGNNYTTASILIGQDISNVRILLLEKFPCLSRDELSYRERTWQDNMPCINQLCPINSDQERVDAIKNYYLNNKAKFALYNNKYGTEHKEERNLKNRQIIKCDNCFKSYTRGNHSYHYNKYHSDIERPKLKPFNSA